MVGSILGRSLYFAGATGHGRRSGTSLSRIGRGLRDSQGWTARRAKPRNISSGTSASVASSICSASFGLFAADHGFSLSSGHSRIAARCGSVTAGSTNVVAAGGTSMFSAPSVSPAYLGVGYIIGLRLASIQFAGGVLAWGLMVPLLIYFLGPQLRHYLPADTPENWAAHGTAVWRFIVRPIAVGGMLVGAAYTLFKMRKSLTAGLGQGVWRFAADRRRARQALAYRTIYEFESRLRLDRAHVRADVFSLCAAVGPGLAGDFGGRGHAHGRLFLCYGFWKSGRVSLDLRIIRFQADAFHVADRGAAYGLAGSFGNGGCGGGAERGGGGLRFVGGRG